MTPKLQALRDLLEKATPRRWYDRGRHISLVPDNTGVGATLPTNHIANFAEHDDCALTVAIRNSADALLDVVEAAVAWRDSMRERGWSDEKPLLAALSKLES